MAKPRTSGVKGRTSETFNKARNERQKAVLLRYVARHEFDNGVAVRNASLALRAETLALCEQAEKLTRGGGKTAKPYGRGSGTAILNGWKEIAQHIGRGVRTVQRWERSGLPVLRPQRHTPGAVVAFSEQIDAWLRAAEPSGNVAKPELLQERQTLATARAGRAETLAASRAARAVLKQFREEQHVLVEQLRATKKVLFRRAPFPS